MSDSSSKVGKVLRALVQLTKSAIACRRSIRGAKVSAVEQISRVSSFDGHRQCLCRQHLQAGVDCAVAASPRDVHAAVRSSDKHSRHFLGRSDLPGLRAVRLVRNERLSDRRRCLQV